MAPLWDKKAAAKALSVSTRTLDRMRAEGSISALWVRGSVRFRPEDIEATVAKMSKAKPTAR